MCRFGASIGAWLNAADKAKLTGKFGTEEEEPMKKLISIAVLGSAGLVLAACGSSDDRSTEATPDTVEMPADAALEAVVEEPVVDEEVEGPEIDPAANAPDPVTTEQAADAAAEVAAQAAAAAEEAAAAAEAAEAAASLPIDD